MATGGFWSLTGAGKSLTMHLERPAPRRGAADDGKCAVVYGSVLTLLVKVSTLNIFLLVLFFGRRGWAGLGFKGGCACKSALKNCQLAGRQLTVIWGVRCTVFHVFCNVFGF